MDIRTKVRGHAYVLGVLKEQQADPYCRSCNSFVQTLTVLRESKAAFERENAGAVGALPADLARIFTDSSGGIAALQMPEQPVGQKKAGNCRLPEGVCFLKSSVALLQKIS